MNKEEIEKREQKEKVLALYTAVGELLAEGIDWNHLKVEDITQRAGIGKGTAYEYFESKEDIIASAIVYIGITFFDHMLEEIKQCNGFQNKVSACFAILESGLMKSECLYRILHMLFGADTLSSILQERMQQKKEKGPRRILDYMAQCGLEEGILRKDLPKSYLSLVMSMKFFAYLVYLNNRHIVPEVDAHSFKEMVYEGMLLEIGQR